MASSPAALEKQSRRWGPSGVAVGAVARSELVGGSSAASRTHQGVLENAVTGKLRAGRRRAKTSRTESRSGPRRSSSGWRACRGAWLGASWSTTPGSLSWPKRQGNESHAGRRRRASASAISSEQILERIRPQGDREGRHEIAGRVRRGLRTPARDEGCCTKLVARRTSFSGVASRCHSAAAARAKHYSGSGSVSGGSSHAGPAAPRANAQASWFASSRSRGQRRVDTPPSWACAPERSC
jgi:hypothetical protein